jgi:hypothetical protein
MLVNEIILYYDARSKKHQIEFYDADSLFCHSAYVTWSSGRLTRQHASHISVVAHIS